MTTHQVCVDVATVWIDPTSPRDVDAPAVSAVPEIQAWTASMDAETRLGLHGRADTQLVRGEPVAVVEIGGEWAKICAPWQPSPRDDRGYPGWVRASHLTPFDATTPAWPIATIEPDRVAITDFAQRFKGLRYLWGGLSPWGLDCSGLVHYSYRQAGVVIPRDASAQQVAARPIALGDEQPGDLYFFAGLDQQVTHVGFVTDRLRMLHAPEHTELIEDTHLQPDRLSTLVAAGRFLDA